MNNGINPAYAAPAAPIAPLDMGSPPRDAPVVAHAPPSIKLEYLQKKQAMRKQKADELKAEQAAGATESARKTLVFQGG